MRCELIDKLIFEQPNMKKPTAKAVGISSKKLTEEQPVKITIEELEAYLSTLYNGRVTDQSLFMKLVEEIGEVAEILNKLAGRKK